jgi:glutamyl-tRNA reductase
MHLFVVGLSHKTAPVEIREKLSFPEGCLPDALRALCGREEIMECCILSTCNRTEVYAVTEGRSGEEAVLKFLSESCGMPSSEFESMLYVRRGHKAVEHLFGVAAGLDSMMIGEDQILGQVKDAFRCGVRCKSTGTVLNELFKHAITTGKRARSETDISRGAFSVGCAVVALAKSVLGSLDGRSVLIIGAGKMAELTARHMQSAGVSDVVVANRTPSRAAELAEKLGGRVVPFTSIDNELVRVDVAIGSTGASKFILERGRIEQICKMRSGVPLLLIDIAVPRDFDPDAALVPGVHLYSIDDLQEYVECSSAEREREVEKVKNIVAEETHEFNEWMRTLESVPLIKAIRAKLEGIRDAEWERVSAKLSHLSEADLNAVRMAMQSLINRISHNPIVTIKEYAVSDGGADKMAIAKELFGVDEEDVSSGAEPGDKRSANE